MTRPPTIRPRGIGDREIPNGPSWLKEARAESAQAFRARFPSVAVSNAILGPVSGDSTTLYVYDYIDAWGISATTFAEVLDEVATPKVLVRINSPGGDVFDGVAIHNLLRGSDLDVTIQIDGLAASSASVIAMGSDRREISVGAQVMIHDPWAVAVGNASDMLAFAALLDAQGANLAEIYAARTGQDSADEWRSRMLGDADGTWYQADAALEAGLVTAISSDGGEPAAVVSASSAEVERAVEAVRSEERRAERVASARRDLLEMTTNKTGEIR